MKVHVFGSLQITKVSLSEAQLVHTMPAVSFSPPLSLSLTISTSVTDALLASLAVEQQ